MYKNNGFFLRRRVARPKIMDFFCAAGLQVKKRWPVFCAAGLHVKKRWPFSALQGCMSKNDGPFSAPQGCMSRNGGPFSAPQGCASKNDGCFLPTEANRGKIVWFHGFLRHIFIRNRFAIRQKYLPLHSKIENFNRFNGRLSFGNLWFIGVKFSATQLISTP